MSREEMNNKWNVSLNSYLTYKWAPKSKGSFRNILILFLSALFLPNQLSAQKAFRHDNGLDAEDSVILKDFLDTTSVHHMFSGYWGENNHQLKHLVFHGYYSDTSCRIKASVINTQHTSKPYLLDFEFIGIGSYPQGSGIIDVFTYDVDSNGTSELLIVQSGYIRCQTEYEREDPETGESKTVVGSATCDYFESKVYKENEAGILENFDSLSQIGDDYPSESSTVEKIKVIYGLDQ